ncbi:MAG: hypothetical protein AAFZ91_16305 [Pseudomonadota bacterium]
MLLRSKIKAFIASGITHIAFAFIVMGAWAVFANRQHLMPEPVIAGLVQGALSATITLLMKKALDCLSTLFFRQNAMWCALIAPPMVVCSVSLTVLVLSHVMAGTPEVLATIAVPFSVAFTYAWIYSMSIWNTQRTQT